VNIPSYLQWHLLTFMSRIRRRRWTRYAAIATHNYLRVLTNFFQRATAASKAVEAAHPGVLLRAVTLHEADTAASRAAAKADTVDKSRAAASSSTRSVQRCPSRSMRCIP
jgi:hypothetical protein